MTLKFKLAGLFAATLLSSAVHAVTTTSTGSGNWSTGGTWDSGVPTAGDDAVIAAGHTVTVDTAASAVSVNVQASGTLDFSVSNNLSVGIGGISVAGTIDATNAGSITSAATNGSTHGVYVLNTGSFTAGNGAITLSATNGLGLENDGAFTGGAGLITTSSFRNGIFTASASFTVGTGGMNISGYYYPTSGTILLNGDISIGQVLDIGAATVSGSGKMILADGNDFFLGNGGLAGSLNVHNLQTATFTAPRVITFFDTVNATGTTKLYGSAAGAVSFALAGGATPGTFTPATTAYYCTSNGGETNISCHTGAPPSSAIAASIDFFVTQSPKVFAQEIDITKQ